MSKKNVSGKSQSKPHKTRLFISYSRQDQAPIQRLHDELSKNADFEVFLDTLDILPSEEWKPRLEGLIRSSDTFLFALSANSVASEVCQWELKFANSLNKRIIPIALQDTSKDTPASIAKLNYIFLDEKHDFHQSIKTISAAIDIDIDWVREHTRIGDLSNRWERAQELDIQPLRGKELDAAEKWLASQPKNAPQPTPSQRQYIYDSRKSATKRQRLAVAGSLIALLVVGVLGVFALVQRNAAIEGERKAQAALSAATMAANTLVFDLANDFQNSSVPSPIIESILDKARALQKELSTNFPDDPDLQRSEANALSALGDLYLVIKDTKQANIAYEESLESYFDLAERDPSNTLWWQDVSIGLGKVSNIKAIIGDMPGAISTLEDSLLVTNDLLAFDPDNSDWQRDLAVSLNKISNLYLFIGEEEKQLAALTQSAQAFRTLAELAPNDLNRQYDLSVGLSDFASAIENTDRNGARQLYEEVLTISQKLIEADSSNTLWRRALATSLDKIANLDLQDGRINVALPNYTKSLEIARALLELDPQNTRRQADVAITLNKLGHANRQMKNYETALSIYQESLSIRRALFAQDANKLVWQRGVSDNLDGIGDMSWELEDLDGALIAFQESLAIRRDIALKAPASTEWLTDVSNSLIKIGTISFEQLNYETALEAFEESLGIWRNLAELEPDVLHWQMVVWEALEQIGNIKSAQGDDLGMFENYQEQLIALQKLAIMQPENKMVYHQISFALAQIGRHHYGLEDLEKAYELFSELLTHATEMTAKFPDDENFANDAEYARINTAEVMAGMANAAILENEYAKAEDLLHKAIALDPQPLWIKNMLAFVLMWQDKLDEADEIFLMYKGQQMSENETWDKTTLRSINQLRKLGLSHPHMIQIEAMFDE